ncbi:MAG TPA: signal peptide peptidase SppA [Syntrophomonadaceae bacterium]|nr:signal peptide peptidase SppA [Syntrophomonadaceae bacterium]
MNRKRWIALGVVIILFIVYIRTDVSQSISGNDWRQSLFSTDLYTTETYQEGMGKTIAILSVEGIIQDQADPFLSSTSSYNHQVFLKQLEEAFINPEIKAIVLAVDSPGGGVFESDEIYQDIVSLKKKYQKPLIVSMGSMAASGGYYISAPADKIFAHRNTITGSIGVIMSTINYHELTDKLGIRDETFKSGDNKDLLNPMRDITEEERQIMQGIIDESYQYFVDVVAEGRDMKRQEVIKIADGRIYTARQAKELGLIDGIGTLDDAIKEAARMINEKDPHVILFKTDSLFSLERWLAEITRPSIDILGMERDLQKSTVPSLLYLYQY